MPEHSIQVDDEVFEDLQRQAKPFIDTPNSVLRRLLGLDQVSRPAHPTRNRKPALAAMVIAGILQPEQQLVWRRRNLGEVHVAYVTRSGHIRLANGDLCATPSRAAEAAAGCKINGWDAWHTEHGSSLNDLRTSV